MTFEILNIDSFDSEGLEESESIVSDESESKIVTDNIPFDINISNNETDVPMTIKSKPEENLHNDQNNGAQLGLF